MTPTRRSVLGGLIAAPAAASAALTASAAASAAITASAAPAAAHGAGTGLPRRLPPVVQRRIGRFTVSFVTDGHADLPFGAFTGQPEAATGAAVERLHLGGAEGTLRLGFTQYLIDDGERLVLVDAGPAGLIGETGRLPEAFAALGITADDIDALVLTHGHFDHVAGAIAGGARVFRNAEVYMDRRDVAHFTDPARRAAAPGLLHSSYDAVARLVALYPDLQRIEGAHRLVPGLETVDLTGHTPGQIGLRVADGGESLLIVSDMLFSVALHPESAATGIAFEEDPAAAAAMRRRFFPAAAEEGALIAATHLPFPGLGRIVGDGRGGLEWAGADWAHGA